MKQLIKNLTKLTTASLAVLTLTSLFISPVQAEKRKLIVGIEDGYYPYEYLNDEGVFTGYDVEVIDEVCAIMNAECKLDRGGFDALIPNLLYKKSDLVISALSITDERKKRVAFSTSYVPAAGAIFLVNNNQQGTPDTFKVVGVQQGTTIGAYLASLNKYKIKLYPSFDTAVLDLKAGRVEAVFESDEVAKGYYADSKHGLKVSGDPIFDPRISQGTGIAVRPDDTELLAQINNALAILDSKGRLAELRKKYGLDAMKTSGSSTSASQPSVTSSYFVTSGQYNLTLNPFMVN